MYNNQKGILDIKKRVQDTTHAYKIYIIAYEAPNTHK